MIDNYLLEELITFAREKTLAKTAKALMVTQPTVTRGMQKLEEELDVQLFNRQPNRITLTKVGQLAAKEAEQVIATNTNFVNRIRNYARQQTSIKLASIAPGPLIITKQVQQASTDQLIIHEQLINENQVQQLLTNNQYSIIISTHEIQTPEIESRFLGVEQLYVNLDQFMYLANFQQVSFRDLHGLSFIVLDEIGPWKKIIQNSIPSAKFLYQDELAAMVEISKYSNFPYFSTNVTYLNSFEPDVGEDRVTLPITDRQATMTFYLSYLTQNKKQLQPLITALSHQWPQLNQKQVTK